MEKDGVFHSKSPKIHLRALLLFLGELSSDFYFKKKPDYQYKGREKEGVFQKSQALLGRVLPPGFLLSRILSPNFDLKTMISTNTKDFSWDKMTQIRQIWMINSSR
jgi:hypothetical protein